MKKRGRLITFEGTEGSGKSTQIRMTAAYLRQKGLRPVILREPGGTRVSEAIRKVILDTRNKNMTPETELLLYLAARAQIVREKIEPALRAGKIVLCDRFEDSTLAYQGFGRGFGVQGIRQVSRGWVRGSLQPDLTVLLDIDPAQGMKRGGRRDRMEKQSLLFHRRVRNGFLRLARAEKRRFLVLDGRGDCRALQDKIQSRLRRVLG